MLFNELRLEKLEENILILALILIFIALSMYLVMVGANKTKTNRERMIEDEEQIRFLNNLNKK